MLQRVRGRDGVVAEGAGEGVGGVGPALTRGQHVAGQTAATEGVGTGQCAGVAVQILADGARPVLLLFFRFRPLLLLTPGPVAGHPGLRAVGRGGDGGGVGGDNGVGVDGGWMLVFVVLCWWWLDVGVCGVVLVVVGCWCLWCCVGGGWMLVFVVLVLVVAGCWCLWCCVSGGWMLMFVVLCWWWLDGLN